MEFVYVVINSHEGTTTLFNNKVDACICKIDQRVKMHEKYCVNKKVPSYCACNCTLREVECDAHYYVRTVQEHRIKACPFYRKVYIEERQIL